MSSTVAQTPARVVPFMDLSAQHAILKAEILDDLADLIDSNAFTNGPQVAEFEAAFADFCGTRFAVGVANGLDGLRLALIAAGIEPGDEVIVPANTFVATLEAVVQAGGRPLVVDALEEDYNLDAAASAAAVTPKTRFVIPVHLYGQLADMRPLLRLARAAELTIVEDACQAHGASRDGIGAGTAGVAGAFSFYPGKNLGAFGDAGAVVTDDRVLAEAVRSLRHHGERSKYEHEVQGYTSRLDTVQALVLLHKLPYHARWNEERRSLAVLYNQALAGIGDLRLPPVPEGSEPVWHLYPVRSRERDALGAFLSSRGIGSGRHYPTAVHLTPAYAWLGHRQGEFPVAEALADELLSLPIFPGMSEDDVVAVTGAIDDFFRRG
jgi:dTDP-4-amino-4,6-dideoxygalactose transaminase